MSANNHLRIFKEGLVWKVRDEDIEMGGGVDVGDEYQSLEDAIEAANEYEQDPENEVEYGITFDFPPK